MYGMVFFLFEFSDRVEILFLYDLYRFDNVSKIVLCDGNKLYFGKLLEYYRFEYYIYIMFFDEGDILEEIFFRGMEKMVYFDVIKIYGKKVSLYKEF